VFRFIAAAFIVLSLALGTQLSAAAQTTWNPYKGMWLTRAELDSLPMSGTAWNHVVSVANSSWGSPNISDQDSNHDTNVLGGALYAARTGDAAMRTKTANAIMSAINTENGGRVLALGRNVSGYVIAADLINLPAYNAAMGETFVSWLSSVRNEQMTECDTLIKCHNRRPNNWGTHAGGSRIAADIYLGDNADLALAAKTFKGWLGDRSSYAAFSYGDLSWQCTSTAPVGINRADCGEKSSIIPDDMRRGGSYAIPPAHTNYTWGALEGAAIQAELLSRAGYPAWQWGFNTLNDQAMKRAVMKLDELDRRFGGWWASGDDVATVWIIEHAYHAGFRTTASRAGKAIDFTDWTHNRNSTVPVPTNTSTIVVPSPTAVPVPTLTPTLEGC
jgi:hypothetical protein